MNLGGVFCYLGNNDKNPKSVHVQYSCNALGIVPCCLKSKNIEHDFKYTHISYLNYIILYE